MAERTGIEWTEATWTPVRAQYYRRDGLEDGQLRVGWHCEHLSPGCVNCYAEGINKRLGTGLPFKPGHRKDVDVFLDEKMLLAPLRWKRPRMIFVCSMTDLFADFVTDEMIDRIFAVMALAPQHTFQVLTKRSARMRHYLTHITNRDDLIAHAAVAAAEAAAGRLQYVAGMPELRREIMVRIRAPLPHVWLGVSAEDQTRADERVPDLLATPAAVRWVSAEPLLGPINFTSIDLPGGWHEVWPLGQRHLGRDDIDDDGKPLSRIDWIVVGGESGRDARPMHPQWARDIRDQCHAADVPFFFKQWGQWAHSDQTPPPVPGPSFFDSEGSPIGNGWHFWSEGDRGTNASVRVGKRAAGRELDGVTHDAMPEVRA